MSKRSGSPFRKASARDLGVLALGVLLVLMGVGMSICSSFSDPPGTGSLGEGGSRISSASPHGGHR